MVEIKGGHWENDDCVDEYLAGQGLLIGTDGTLMTHQFFKDLSMPNSHIENMVSGRCFVASPLDVELPVQVLDEKLNFELEDGGIIFATEDGFVSDFYWGSTNYCTDRYRSLSDVNLPEIVQDVVRLAADLYPQEDGICSEYPWLLNTKPP